MSQSILKAAAGIAALAAIAFGASAIASGSKSNSAAVTGAGPPGAMQRGANGGPPPGGPRGGTPVTAATAAKVEAAALAKYPGTVERIAAMPDGNYVAHVFRSGGTEVHVIVNKQFEVTGVATRPSGGGPPPGALPPTANGTSS
jgi:hypothetical protein